MQNTKNKMVDDLDVEIMLKAVPTLMLECWV